MKLKHIAAITTLALLLPFAVSALSIDDIQQQIANLLAQVASLQQQLKLLQTPSPVACTMEAKQCPDGSYVGRSGPNCEFAKCPALPSRICPQILRQLSQGIDGDDVKDLQAYLGVSQTGHFGPMTAKAVAQFQASEGLSQVGIVGPQTRAAFARRCGGGNSGDFSAYPISGQAPLTSHFWYMIGGNSVDGYSISFGDGTSDTPSLGCAVNPLSGIGACPRGLTASHTYTSNGTYTATLLKYQPPQPPCSTYGYAPCPVAMPIPPQVISTLTITVGGSTNVGAPTISGLDAPTSLSVGQNGTWTVHATAPAGTQLSYSVVWGDEYSASSNSAVAVWNIAQTTGTFTHTYQSAGTYTPTFTVSNDSGSAKTSASVTVGVSTTNGTPSISFIYPSGNETFHTGDSITIRWNAQSIPQNATMYLVVSNGIVIKNQIDPNIGSHVWKIPAPESAWCSGFSDAISGCTAESFNRPLTIKAVVYSPSNACLGFCGGPRPTTVASAETSGFRIVVPGGDPSVTSCSTNSVPICGYDGSGSGPKTYSNLCYFSAAKAAKLYDGECDYSRNPSVYIPQFGIHGYSNGQMSGTSGSLRLVGNTLGAYIGDMLDVQFEYHNIESVGTISASIKADGGTTEYASTNFQPNTPSIQMKIPAHVPAATAETSQMYRILLTLKDKNGVAISQTTSMPFLIVVGN